MARLFIFLERRFKTHQTEPATHQQNRLNENWTLEACQDYLFD